MNIFAKKKCPFLYSVLFNKGKKNIQQDETNGCRKDEMLWVGLLLLSCRFQCSYTPAHIQPLKLVTCCMWEPWETMTRCISCSVARGRQRCCSSTPTQLLLKCRYGQEVGKLSVMSCFRKGVNNQVKPSANGQLCENKKYTSDKMKKWMKSLSLLRGWFLFIYLIYLF